MNKKEYIERARQCIVNRVKFHAPILYDDEIDRRALFEKGVDLNLPIFKYEKKMTNHLLKAFKLAQKDEKFNLILAETSLQNINKNKAKKLQNICLFSENDKASFLKSINKLNINYFSSSNYNIKYFENFVSVNGERLNPVFNDFVLSKIQLFDGVLMQYNEFVLNGNNMFISFLNNTQKEQKIALEINLLLKNGYFFIKKTKKNVTIADFLCHEKMFLNYVCDHACFCFSNIDGLPNSKFGCVNIRADFLLKPGQNKKFFFNFGPDKFVFKKSDDFEKLIDCSREISHKIFNVKVKTKNPKFDLMFNRTLPQKIWINWINGTPDVSLEEKYLSYKRMFVRGTDSLSLVPFREIGLRELGVFNGKYYKRLLVVNADRPFFKVGKTIFYNLQKISNSILKSREPVSFSFG